MDKTLALRSAIFYSINGWASAGIAENEAQIASTPGIKEERRDELHIEEK